MTTFAASVTIVDLPVATTLTGTELFEGVQTTAGVGKSVQVSASQIVAFAGASFISSVGTSLATAGTATAMVAFVASGGIGSTQLGALAVLSSNMTTGAVGSTQLGALAVQRTNVTTAAIGSTQLDALAVQQANVTAGAIGSTQLGAFAVNAAQVNTAVLGTAQMVTGAIGMTLLNTLSPNGVASTNDTSSFVATFKSYMITFDNVTPANNTTTLQMTVATSGSNFVSGSYLSVAQVNVSSILITDTSTSALLLSGTRATTALQSSTLYGLSGFIKLFNPSGAISRKQVVGEVSYAAAGSAVNTTTLAQASVNGLFDTSNAITGVNFAFSAGNIATGTIKIYGLY